MGKQKEAEAAGEKITQKEAVKRALAAGKDSPSDGVAFVKEQFGITLNNGGFSTLKTQLKKASGATPAKRGRKPGRPAASSNGTAKTGGISSSGKAGAEAVRDMASVFEE
jgi:hypothetical protein